LLWPGYRQMCMPSRVLAGLHRVVLVNSGGKLGEGLFILATRFAVKESEHASAGVRNLELLMAEVDDPELGIPDTDRGQVSSHGFDIVARP